MSGALISLVAYGKEDAHLNGGAFRSAYFEHDLAVKRSAFAYCSSKPVDGFFEFSCGMASRLGDMYLVYDGAPVPLSCCIEYRNAGDRDWTVLERLSPEAMDAFAAMNPRDYKPRGNAVPLPFFFTGKPSQYLPVPENTTCRVRIDPLPADAELLYKAVYLDSDEHRFGFSGKYLQQIVFSHTTSTRASGPTVDIDLKLENPVKDMQVIVEADGLPESGRRVVVPELELRLNGYTHSRLPPAMTTMIIPSKYYNIHSNPGKIHYMVFSHDPSGPYTSSINFSRIDSAKLYLHGLEYNKSYKVIVVTRHHNTLMFDNGRASLLYPWPAEPAST